MAVRKIIYKHRILTRYIAEGVYVRILSEDRLLQALKTEEISKKQGISRKQVYPSFVMVLRFKVLAWGK
jgi:hypothetical protein